MNSLELYNKFKYALEYFDLNWNQRHLMETILGKDSITFSYGEESLTFSETNKKG